MDYINNSIILITEIEYTSTSNGVTDATSNNGLQCITDRRPCCAAQPNRQGEWIFPDNGGNVPGLAQNPTSFSRNRGDDGTVNLNRLNSDVMMPTGRFCCVVPDATSVDQTVCANIGTYIYIDHHRNISYLPLHKTSVVLFINPVSINVLTTSSGSPSAGKPFSLECSLSGTSDSTTFQWLKGPADNMTQPTSDGSTAINSTSTVSQLLFSPLKASHGGLYTCQATVVGGATFEGSTAVQVNCE